VIPNGDHHLFWSLSFAVHRSLWRDLGGFCEDYERYGCEDTDFGQIAARHEVPLTWLGGAWAGRVNLNWPQDDGLMWPHLVRLG